MPCVSIWSSDFLANLNRCRTYIILNDNICCSFRAASEDVGLVKLLMAHGAKVGVMDVSGKTPLFDVTNDTPEALECLEVLLKATTESVVNHQDNRGYTLLHVAAFNAAEIAAQTLLMNGSDYSIKGNCGNTALAILHRKIPNTPDLLKKILDEAITLKTSRLSDLPTLSKNSKARLESSVTVDFQCILPSITHTASKKYSISQVTPTERSPRIPLNFSRVSKYFKNPRERGNNGTEEKIPMDDYSNRKETAKVKCLLDEGQDALLAHPVIHAFLHLKWAQAKAIFLPALIYKFILAVLFSVYVFLPHMFPGQLLHYHDDNHTHYGHMHLPIHNHSHYEHTDISENAQCDIQWIVMYVIIVAMATLKGFVEFLHFLRAAKIQLRSADLYISLAVLFIMIYGMRPGIWCSTICEDLLHRSLAAFGILLAWTDVWINMSRFPTMGVSIRVFFQVFQNFSWFILPHVCLFIGFLLSFMLIYSENQDYVNVWQTTSKMIRTMAGEIGLPGDSIKGSHPHGARNLVIHLFTIYIYTGYLLIVGIVLTNLLVGLAVNDIQGIYAEASIVKLKKQIVLLNTIESNFRRKWIRPWVPTAFLSKYINLFNPASEQKKLTFKPFDACDKRLGADLKKDLYDVAIATHGIKGNSESIRDCWKSAVSKLVAKNNSKQKEMMKKINDVIARYLLEINSDPSSHKKPD